MEGWNGYLLEEGSKVAGEADWVVNQQVVEVAFGEEGLSISLEVVNVVDCVNHGVEALSEGLVVILETDDGAEHEGFP